jgi:hypothetical protein
VAAHPPAAANGLGFLNGVLGGLTGLAGILVAIWSPDPLTGKMSVRTMTWQKLT